jgi:hypothetical protein
MAEQTGAADAGLRPARLTARVICEPNVLKSRDGTMLGTGYPIAAEAFDLELYQLACTFAASRELTRLAAAHPGLQRLSSVFQESEAARRLISAAAMVRSAIDTWSSVAHANLDAPVGDLEPNTERPEKRLTLGFREACNKILHADLGGHPKAAIDRHLKSGQRGVSGSGR